MQLQTQVRPEAAGLVADRVRRPISLKIFGITLVLLVMMGLISYSATVSMHRVNQQLVLLSDHYIPLDQLEGQVRVHNLQQILAFERIVAEGPGTASFDDVSRLVRQHVSTPDACGPDEQTALAARLRETYTDRASRRMASYERQRLCGDLKVGQAQALVDRALALPFVAQDAAQVQKLTRLQVELGRVPQTRESLHGLMRRYLADMRQAGGRRGLESLQEALDAQRRVFNRESRSIGRLLEADTREAAATAHRLERRAFWFNWGVTALAVLLGLACALLLTRNLVRPVRQLVQGAKAIEEGNLDVRLEVISADELALLTRSFNHMASGLKEKEVIKETFGKYVDPRIVSGLIGESAPSLQAAKRPMTVQFSDIEGLTSLCEQLTPDRVVNLLNEYLSAMSQPIRESHGIIDKYVGDAIMAFWGPPFVPADRHASLACLAALDQLDRLQAFRERIPDLVGLRRGVPAFNVRIGISTGEVTVGNIGSESARNYTVIGDSANLASRLESANKHFGTRIIISEETFLMAQADVEARELDAIRVVGRQAPVRVYELLARHGQLDAARAELRDRYAQGLRAWRAQAWSDARTAFQACVACSPGDGPSALFLRRLEQMQALPAGAAWDGVWTLGEK